MLQFPFASAAEFKSRGSFSGIPFLAPWANWLDEMTFYANGKKYLLNAGLGNVRGPIPSHGFLMTAEWEVVEIKADQEAAWVTSRIEVYRQPDCFEPMAGITDSMNLAQKGLYKDLQYIPPGQSWQESFWIKPSGF